MTPDDAYAHSVLLAALFWSGRSRDADVIRHAESLPPAVMRHVDFAFHIASVAVARSPDEAIRAAQAMGGDEVAGAIHTAGVYLLGRYEYAAAAALLLDARSRGVSLRPAEQRAIEIGERTKPFDANDVSTPARAVLAAVVRRATSTEHEFDQRMFAGVETRMRVAMADMYAAEAMPAMEVEGDDDGYRVTMNARNLMGVKTQRHVYVVKRNGVYQVLELGDERPMLWPLGEEALRLCGLQRTAAAQRWIAWAEKDLALKKPGDDPLSGSLLAALRDSADAGGPETCTFAAALASDGSTDEALADVIVEKLRNSIDTAKKGRSPAHLSVVRLAQRNIVWQLERVKRTADALAASRIMLGALTEGEDSESGRTTFYRLLKKNGSVDELKLAIAKRLAEAPHDTPALRAHMILVESDPNASVADRRAAYRRALNAGIDVPFMQNAVAWMAVFDGDAKEIGEGIALADIATRDRPPQETESAENTLAALYAKAGRFNEAWKLLQNTVDASGRNKLRPGDWLVVGLVYEGLGLVDDARAAYGRVEMPKGKDGPSNKPGPSMSPISSYAAAQIRLTKLSESQSKNLVEK